MLNNNKNIYDYVSDIVFSRLLKTNRLMIINDKDDEFFHSFYNAYKVCNISLIGSVFEDIPWKCGHSVTNLGDSLRNLYLDEALTSPVDVLYMDVTTRLNCENYLENIITDETLVVIKIKHPNDTNVPAIPQLQGKNALKFGDWDEPYTMDSNFFLMFI